MNRHRGRLNPALVRRLNVAKVFHALRLAGGATQAELAAGTGLDPATVSAVVRQLRAEGLVVATVFPASDRRGRPPMRLELDPAAGVLIGARLEPGVVRVLAATLDGTPLGSWQGDAGEDPDAAIADLDRGVKTLLAELGVTWQAVKAVGVGVPALIGRDGHLAFGPNLGWRDVPLGERLTALWPAPVAVDNDTKAAALAEKLFGTAQQARDFVVIAGHSGIGGALYLGERLLRGSGGFAGEVGHITAVPDGRPCGCGDRGCLEAYLAERAVVEQLRERSVVAGNYQEAAKACAAGDPRALPLFEELGDLLGRVLADMVDIVDPELIVLGGAMTHVVPYLLPSVQKRLAEPALAGVRVPCRVEASQLGPEAVTMGGVALALETVLGLPAWWEDNDVGVVQLDADGE
ncbi:MAG TPA: ROK family transcriptional regulator [Trueperaceae bacterium]